MLSWHRDGAGNFLGKVCCTCMYLVLLMAVSFVGATIDAEMLWYQNAKMLANPASVKRLGLDKI